MPDDAQRLDPLVGSAVLLPADAGALQEVGQDRDVDARPSLHEGRPQRLDAVGSLVLQAVRTHLLGPVHLREREGRLERVVAELPLARAELPRALVVDETIGLGGERPQVLDPGRPVDRAEEPVGKDEAVGVGPVVRDVGPRVRHVGAGGEAVHRPAVDPGDPVGEAVTVVRLRVLRAPEPHGLAVARGALRRAVGPRVAAEQVVVRPVLLDQEHDVLDVPPRERDLLGRGAGRRRRRRDVGGIQVLRRGLRARGRRRRRGGGASEGAGRHGGGQADGQCDEPEPSGPRPARSGRCGRLRHREEGTG